MIPKHPLMKPLTSEDLKTRPSTQAVWPLPASAAEPQPPVSPPIPPVQSTISEPVQLPEIPLPVQPPEVIPEREGLPAPDTVEIPSAEEEPLGYFSPPADEDGLSESLFSEETFSAEKAPLASSCLLEIEKELADLLGGTQKPEAYEDDEDDEDDENRPDAVPSENMPEPSFVSLYEGMPATPKRHGWLWTLAVVLLLAAGGGYAVWYFDLMEPVMAWLQPAFESVKAFVSSVPDILP